jgi:hypothetical protein
METEWFYPSRKQAIDDRITELATMSWETMKELINVTYVQHYGIMCSVDWEFELNDLLTIAQGVTPKRLSDICSIMAKHTKRRSGLPDLVLWKSSADGEVNVRLVEVKGPGDTLMDHQKEWLQRLMEIGVDVEVCLVVDMLSVKSITSGKRSIAETEVVEIVDTEDDEESADDFY